MIVSSKTVQYLKVTRNRTRAEAKIVFNIPDKCSTRFLNSQFYKGTQLWNALPEYIQRAGNLDLFSKQIKPMYNT